MSDYAIGRAVQRAPVSDIKKLMDNPKLSREQKRLLNKRRGLVAKVLRTNPSDPEGTLALVAWGSKDLDALLDASHLKSRQEARAFLRTLEDVS